MEINKPVLSVDDIMKYLDASRSTVQRLLRSGRIQAIPIKAPQDKKMKPLRVTKEEFEKFILGE